MGEYNIKRGKKWSDARAAAVYEKRTSDVKWLDSNESVQKDIKEYEGSLKATKSAGKK